MQPYDDLQQSYGRCLREKNFIEFFYELFLSSHPDIARMFAETDFGKQRLALRRGISVAIEHANGRRLVERTMTQMAMLHSRKGRAPVSPSLYHYWVESLLESVRQTDPQANEALIARWREGMGKVIDTFQKHY